MATPKIGTSPVLETMQSSPDLETVKIIPNSLLQNPAIQLLLENTDIRRLLSLKNYILCLPTLFDCKPDNDFFEFHGILFIIKS